MNISFHIPQNVRPAHAPWTSHASAVLVALALSAAPGAALAKATPPLMTRPIAAPPTVRAVETPPPEFASGPTLTGKTFELDLDDPFKVSYLCTLALGATWPPGGYWMGCYNDRMDAVIVPGPGVWPSEAERQALVAHEWAHARGWRHVNDGRFGRPPPGVDYAQEPNTSALPNPRATAAEAQ